MTTTSILDERAAVQIAATLDPSNPDYREAVEIALARRGTRDALVVLLARNNEWDKVLDVFHSLRGGNTAVSENIDAIYATAHAVTGSTAIAQAITRLHPDHKMLELVGKIIERRIPISEWLQRMASLDPDTCYAFKE
jgi:hypothetical protein